MYLLGPKPYNCIIWHKISWNFKKIADFCRKWLFVGPKLNLIYLCDFICEFNSEYIKRRRLCITYDNNFFFVDSLSVSAFFMILAKFVFFCKIFLYEDHFWNFEMMRHRQSQKTILKNCRKIMVQKSICLNTCQNEKWMWFFLLKFVEFSFRKLNNRTQVYDRSL